MSKQLDDYPALLRDIKGCIQGAQVRAALAANRELLMLYWDVGRLIAARKSREGWGAAVVSRLARDLGDELPGIKGFSETNLKRMVQYFESYPGLARRTSTSTAVGEEGAQAVPQLLAAREAVVGARGVPQKGGTEGTPASAAQACARLSLEVPWGHNILLMQKVGDLDVRGWYLNRCVDEGWSRDVLAQMIKSQAHVRQGAAITNFAERLPAPQSDLAQQALKDPYVFDFLTLDAPFRERELETQLLAHLEHFLLELGVGFSFVGRQYPLSLDGDDFYLDLLFYHLKLRCFVVVDLKIGPFEAEHAGKMNLYLNLVDDVLRHATDQPSIGLILCQDKKRLLVEYALRGLNKPIGVSEYELTRALPKDLKSALPSIESIEAELADDAKGDGP